MRWWPALLVALAGCSPESRFEPSRDEPAAPPTCLRLPQVIDFGEVGPAGANATFFIFNDSSRLQHVTLSALDPPFFSSHVGGFNVNIGGSTGVVFAFRPADPRLHLGEASFTGGDGCEPQIIALRGLGTGSLSIDEPLVEFGKVPLHERRTRTVTLRNTRRVALDVEVVVSSPGVAAPELVHVPELGTAQLELVAEPTQVSLLDGSVLFRSRDAEHRLHDTLTLDITGRGGAPRLRLIEQSIAFGRVPLGTSPRHWVGVVNDGEVEAELGPVMVQTTAGAPSELLLNFLTPPGTLFPGDRFDFELQVVPTAPGPRAWTLLITGDAPGQPLSVDVSASLEAIGPCSLRLVPTPQSIRVPDAAFPFVTGVTFDNPTDAACLIDSISLDPPQWEKSVERQVYLAAHASTTVNITATTPAMGFFRFQTWGWPAQVVPVTIGF